MTTTPQHAQPSPIEDRAAEDFAFVEQTIRDKPVPEQIRILARTLRQALVRQYTVQAENSALIAECDRLQAAFLETQRAIENAFGTCRKAPLGALARVGGENAGQSQRTSL